MLKPKTNITITQQGSGRTKIFFFDFVTEWNFSSSWENLSSTGNITFPKNIWLKEQSTNSKYPLFGTNKKLNDIFQKGDKIKIETYCIYWDKNNNEVQTDKNTIIDGYISGVHTEMPVVLDFEDNMFLLKQIPMTNKSFPASTSIESILKRYLTPYGFTVNNLTETTLTYDNALLTAENETVAQFLLRLKKDANFNSYIRGNELRIGSWVYIESEAKQKKFEFQNNIISSELEYMNTKDISISCIASNHITIETGKFTKTGEAKTKDKKIQVFVTIKNEKIVSQVVTKDHQAPPNAEGERHTFYFLTAKTTDELIKLATDKLKQYYYTGFKGNFETFGFPFVQFGDNAEISNPILTEQNGLYKIRSVDYSGGVNGYRQNIKLDYKIR